MEIIHENSKSFIVKETKLLDSIASIIFWIMFFSAVYYNNFHISSPRLNVKLFYLTLFPAIYYFIKAIDNRNIIEINETGFYYYGSLVTSWDNFIEARYSQDEMNGDISDKFVLLIEYYKPNIGSSFVCKIPLSNTQNKSEEDIINAIQIFSKK